jgi:predicted dehydrogenase
VTPPSGQFDLVQLTLNHGNHVLCEKPFVVNANETKALFDMAREKRLFVMEAMWTRVPPSYAIYLGFGQGWRTG